MRMAIAGLALTLAACGGTTTSLTVDDATYRAPLTDKSAGVAYFSITSSIQDKIIGLSSPQADRVEMHNSVTSAEGMASMVRLDSVDLPAGKSVIFGPGALHVMVFAPQPIAAGATFPIQIELESGRNETISFAQTLAPGR